MYFAIRLRLLRGETREADELAEAAFALSTKHGFTLWTALIVFMQGWSLCQQGRVTDGVTRMRTGHEDALATGHKAARTMYCSLFAEAYGRIGQVNEGWQMLSEALDAAEQSGQRYYEAETYRLNPGRISSGPKPPFSAPSISPAASRRSHGSCAPRPALPGYGRSRAGGPRPTTCLRRSTAGSPRGSTRPT
jgi:hypothetical protein